MNQQLQKYQWILILVVAMIGGGLCMDIGHEWGDDFAMYLHQAQCWIDGLDRICTLKDTRYF